MKYICNICNLEFNESDENKHIKSLLVRSIGIYCPKCKTFDINLTNHGKLQIERKTKISKIENNSKN